MEQNENNENKSKTGFGTFISKYGSYIAILVCLLTVAGLSCIFLPDRPNKNTQDSQKSQSTEKQPDEDENNTAVIRSNDMEMYSVLNPNDNKPINTPAPDFTIKPKANVEPEKVAKLSPPVNGEIIWGYAMDELIYSATLDQWTTHSGVDIAANIGDKVHAADGGTVTAVYNDDYLGTTVVITHKNGDKTVYSNLAEGGSLIKEGTSVKAGDVIGECGNTAVMEIAMRGHIHFEYLKDGKSVPPTDYVLFITEEQKQ